ncbi:MAG: c-type cytochrome [Gammaproteobacteria bacterium]|nr:c-type cytochrome [Gammaproteobacteria bacterium]
MHHPDHHTFNRFIRFLAFLIGVAVAPVVLAASGEPPAPISTVEAVAPALTGQQVYNNVCIACHYPPGVGGAPALGDTNAWTPRIAQGMDTLIDHALNGFTGSTGVMPMKGERVDLSDEEIIVAVEYMVEQVDQ